MSHTRPADNSGFMVKITITIV